MNVSVDFWTFIENSNNAQTVDELFDCLVAYSSQLGLDRVLYTLMTNHPSINQKAGHGVVRSYPEDWMSYYFEKGYENIDPVRRYKTSWYHGPFFWDQLERVYSLSTEEKRVLDEGKEAKLLDGLAVPLLGVGGEIAGMGFASSDGGVKLDKSMLSFINALAHQFNLAYRGLISNENNLLYPSTHLTAREKDVLNWVATGKSNGEIAEILTISEHTIDFHLRNIFKKLNVTSRIAAVVKAIRLNLIAPV
jgi:DNA-binding CsgD family transcriptional regulator